MAAKALTPSREQQKVIAYRGGHLQVIACAGSGKTEAISQRVASLIVEGTPPSGIVAFTFTERAAASMKSRILQRVAERRGPEELDRLSPMFVGTIHSYCLRLLQDHVPQYADFELLDEHRLVGLLSREHKRLELGQLSDKVFAGIRRFIQSVDVVENELIPAEQLEGTPFGEVYGRFLDTLRRYHFLTFGQLISEAVRALDHPEVFSAVHAGLRHLIVDEYQDVNPAQEKLINLLAQPPVHLCVVGDDDQAIYQWRGSNVENILQFRERYRAQTLTLSSNRRSRPGIVETANGFAQSSEPRLPKKMVPLREASKSAIQAWSAQTPDDEAAIIADAVRGLISRGFRYRDIAILLRSVRTSSVPILGAFRNNHIPFRCGGRTGLFYEPEAQVLGQGYAWLTDNKWQAGPQGEGEQLQLADLVAKFSDAFDLDSSAVKRLEKYLEKWREESQRDEGPANLVRGYYSLLRLLGVHKWDLEDPETAARVGTLARFSELLADFEHVRRRARWVDEGGEAVYRAGQDRGTWFYRNLFNYLQYYARDTYEDFEGEETFDLDAVDVLTVHQAKGLEWPIVFVPCLVKQRFPSAKTGTAPEWYLPDGVVPVDVRKRYAGTITDERRLFYVAMTRAKELVYLSRFRHQKKNANPSPFLLEVAGGDPSIASAVEFPPKYAPDRDEQLPKPTFSFSDLAHYEHCPFGFRMGSLLGFQPQLVPELGYGKAIHHTLRRLADYVRETRSLPSARQLDEVLDAEFYLPYAHRFTYQRLREEARRIIDRYLAQYRDDLFRVWETERPFELHLDEGNVTGRADVILDREGGEIGSLALVDYKTAADLRNHDTYAFQLAIYAAAGRGEGLNVRAAYVHELKAGDRLSVPIADHDTQNARRRAGKLAKAISQRQFDAKPAKKKCSGCDLRLVCRHGPT